MRSNVKLGLLSLFSLIVAIISISINYSEQTSSTQKKLFIVSEEDLFSLKDRMDLAMKQEFELTKDPATNTVPRERLLLAHKYIKELQNQATNNKIAGAIPGVNWQERGPNNCGGRTRTIMVDPNDATKKTVWSAGVAGGLWKTTDIELTSPIWTSQNDFFASIAITSMCYDPNNTQVFYFGTGEGYFNADFQRGNGIWKSIDGGTTWNQLASTNANANFYYVNRMVVHSSGDVYAATNSGVFRSQNGGTTWTSVLSTSSGAVTNNFSDIEVATNDQIWASTRTSGAIYKSSSGNVGTWVQQNTGANGFPASGATRIDFALAPSNPNVCYAFVAQGGVNFYKTSNGGANWTLLTKPVDADGGIGNDITRTQFWYDMSIAVDPLNDAVVFVGGVDLFKSTNSGSTWQQISHWYGGFGFQEVHADQHIAIFEQGNSNVIYFGNDGGIWQSKNATAVIPTITSKHDNYNVTQFYHCAIHPTAYSNYFLAGAQDNGSHQFTQGGIGSTSEVTGGDGCFVHIDQNEPQYQFTSYVYSNYYRSTDGGASFSTLTSNNTGSFVNPSDYDNISNNFYASYSAGSYSRVLNAPVLSALSSVTIASFNSGNVTTLTCSQNTADRVFFGINNGRIVRVDNANTATPTEVYLNSGAGMPSSSVSGIAIENGNDNHLLVTYSSYGVNSVWETTNGGTSWTSVEGNIPDMPVRCALFNPNNSQQALIGTELGVWSTDLLNGAATNWAPSNSGLANTRVTQLQIRTSDKLVIASTHGRGLFSSDIFADPNPDFVANKIITYINKPVNFTDASYKSTSWNWNFGDGGNSASKNPAHTYSSPGIYTVSLQINGSLTATKAAYIQVLPNKGTPYNTTAGGNFEVSAVDFGSETISGTAFQRGSSAIAAKSGTNSGTNAWVTGISASSYASNSNSKLYTPNYNLSALGTYTLSFYKKNLFESGWDGFRVEYSLDKGDNWSILGGVSAGWYDFANSVQTTSFPINEPYFNSTSASFALKSIDISFLAGNPNVAFRFVFKSDGSVNSAGVAIDDFQISGTSNDPLPVQFLNFSGVATESSNLVLWSTASESNNAGFELERSASGFDWEKLVFIKGAGNSSETKKYNFLDMQPSSNTCYYRLKQMDYNGQYTYSKTISITRNTEQGLYLQQVFPNPTNGIIHLNFNKHTEKDITLVVYDMHGKTLIQKVIEAGQLNYLFDFTSYGLANGSYLLCLKSANYSYSQRIIKS
ncbi:MAG TPA: PKD domain-containing protein [Bacteroidia bacterium]|nr:PKD domain-containing protein [Bacteroidia bacterium]HRH09199.1 PKD domain-containing protein [Bacteroidia bacterium]